MMRVVVCDGDAVLRGVVSDVVDSLGGEVLAETDSAGATLALVERFQPDVVVMDLVLQVGSGLEVIDRLAHARNRPRVIVFTAHDTVVPVQHDFIDVTRKPDLEGLRRLLASMPQRDVERRKPTRAVASPRQPAVDDSDDFFRILNDAQPGDVLVALSGQGIDMELLASAVRRTVRKQDRVLRRSGDVLALLIAGGPPAVPAFQDRLRATIPDIEQRTRSTDVGDDPTAAFSSLGSG